MAVICVLSHPPNFPDLIESVDYPLPDHISLRIISTTPKTVARKVLALDKTGEIDVFLSGGVMGAAIRNLPLRGRFVNLDITGFDLMMALSKAATHSDRVALITHGARIETLR